jgi:DnaJ-class molecular chaperone
LLTIINTRWNFNINFFTFTIEREGDHIICEMPLTFAQMALGAEVEVPTVHGKGCEVNFVGTTTRTTTY